ncbi:hypothetical protein BP6252_09139 [Coleophoma cylindrospora]|uniref:Uncharacterized protein n=1 Tax=Coleophoma cylindrospora TaxID=1849047 RepID=A0A3D8R123_9HELO|nr:hypothetical protein BP6252_09139 [Coleophoma cylindrospora]
MSLKSPNPSAGFLSELPTNSTPPRAAILPSPGPGVCVSVRLDGRSHGWAVGVGVGVGVGMGMGDMASTGMGPPNALFIFTSPALCLSSFPLPPDVDVLNLPTHPSTPNHRFTLSAGIRLLLNRPN